MYLPISNEERTRRAEAARAKSEAMSIEFNRRQTLSIAERIACWRSDEAGDEVEGVIELLVDAEELAAAVGARLGDVSSSLRSAAGSGRSNAFAALLASHADTLDELRRKLAPV